MEIIFSMQQLRQAAQAFWEIVANARVIAFHGKMGAGKTTFIHALCDSLKVSDIISSPTFSIINEYSFIKNHETRKIYHIDLYRLKDELEAMDAGVEDALYSDHLCLVEWPEKIPSLLPDDSLHVFLEPIDAETRKLRIGDN